MGLLHVCAELPAAAAQRYPVIVAHLAPCGPDGENFDGLSPRRKMNEAHTPGPS
jgi:hypothetical protein